MKPRLEHILEVLEEIAPGRLAETWDNPGLQVGGRDHPVGRILISLDPTLEAVQEASRIKADLLVTHHPLIFKPLSSIQPDRYPGDVLYEAVLHRIAVASAHTNLDAARGGVNDLLAGLLGLKEIEVLDVRDDPCSGEGIGRLGLLSAPIPLSDLVVHAKRVFGTPTVGVVGRAERIISSAAVVGGSGGGLVAIAAKKGADVLITGDIGHHDALNALSHGLAVIDAGHFHTEKAAMSGFRDAVKTCLESAGYGAIEVDVFRGESPPMRHQ
ncbi:MAG: Nif3-like dinuclear metal center hexameric protein [Thermodesulfobacteriota bacterium]